MELLLLVLSIAVAAEAKSFRSLFDLSSRLNGVEDSEFTPRVIGGRDAKEKEFPWMVSLHYGGRFICSAFLVTPTTVMTAAHCVVFGREPEDPKRYNAYLGTINRDGPDTEVLFKEIIAHPEYGSDTEYDIALMKLEKPVELNDGIQTICLPEKGDLYESQIAQVMGWGVTQKNGRSSAEILQTAEQDVPKNSDCQAVYGILGIPVTERHVCAGGDPDSGICFGDSGSPLVSLNETQPVAVGVASFGSYLGCAVNLVPAVYTNIESYMDWIQENMGDDAGDLCYVKKTSVSGKTRRRG